MTGGDGEDGEDQEASSLFHTNNAVVAIGCAIAFGLLLVAGVVANGVLTGHWTLTGSGLFNRDSDVGAVAWLVALSVAGVIFVVSMAFCIVYTAWRYRRAGLAAVRALSRRPGHYVKTGDGRTGAGRIETEASTRGTDDRPEEGTQA